LLDAAQWFSNRFTVLTGLTKFVLEKWTLIASVVLFMGSDIVMSRFSPPFILLDLSFVTGAIIIVRFTEREEDEFLTKGELWIVPHFTFLTRISILIVWTVSGMNMLLKANDYIFFCSSLCMIAYAYFSACIWLRDIREPAPIPEPSS